MTSREISPNDSDGQPKLSSDELIHQFRLLRTDPARFLALANRCLEDDPDRAAETLHSRHNAWRALGRPDLALADLNRSDELRRRASNLMSRANLLVEMGRFAEALRDLDAAQAMEPEEWVDCWGPYFRADCHARLGNEAAALADCADLPDDHWTPGVEGAPAGNK